MKYAERVANRCFDNCKITKGRSRNSLATATWGRYDKQGNAYRVKEIRIHPIMECLPKHEVRHTILHEIAHLLTPGHHHDRTWKTVCLSLGIAPDVTYKGPHLS